MEPHRETPAQIPRNLGNFWSHGNVLGKKQGFSPYALRHWYNPKILELQMRNGLQFWIQNEKSRLLVSGQEFLAISKPPRGQKHPKKWPLYHVFDIQKAVLEEWRFGGENEHQIKKFQLGSKVDKIGFPTSPLRHILDTFKCPKIGPKVA